MKRAISIILILLFILPVYSADEEKTMLTAPLGYKYEAYRDDEFPSWAMELRRSETVFFGSFVITLPLSMLSFSLANRYSPSFNPDPGTMMLYQVGAACTLSLVVVLIDYILGLFEE